MREVNVQELILNIIVSDMVNKIVYLSVEDSDGNDLVLVLFDCGVWW